MAGTTWAGRLQQSMSVGRERYVQTEKQGRPGAACRRTLPRSRLPSPGKPGNGRSVLGHALAHRTLRPARGEARRSSPFTSTGDQRSGRRGPRRRRPRDLGDGTTLLPILARSGERRLAVIDTEDRRLVEHLKWSADEREQTTYATCLTRGDHYGKRLHQVLLGRPPDPSLSVDHVNRDGLDNRRSNLRWATASEQVANRGASGGSITSHHRSSPTRTTA